MRPACCIGQPATDLKRFGELLRESPLTALRQLLPDEEILHACRAAGHAYRNRLYGPVVTVFHFLLQAIQREESFAATWPALWSPVCAGLGWCGVAFSSSAWSQARSRFPKEALESLNQRACAVHEPFCSRWRGLRLLALDGTTVSMPRAGGLCAHFGLHHARTTAVRYPLATFCSLLSVGNSLILDYRFGPFDPAEKETATPLLKSLGPLDLLLIDRGFSGAPTLARVRRQGAHFLARKNARLIVERLPVIQPLGRDDFITEIPVGRDARSKDPTLPENVRVRVFKARWKTPAGERLEDWFVTSLEDPRRFPPRTLARLYHQRWQVETSYLEFKVLFHADVLRGKTVENVQKELAAHVLAYQLVRRLMVQAAAKHRKKPTEISFLNAARWVLCFSALMSVAPLWKLPALHEGLLDAIASSEIEVRPGRLEPRALTREWKHYPHLRLSRSEWRRRRLAGAQPSLS